MVMVMDMSMLMYFVLGAASAEQVLGLATVSSTFTDICTDLYRWR